MQNTTVSVRIPADVLAAVQAAAAADRRTVSFVIVDILRAWMAGSGPVLAADSTTPLPPAPTPAQPATAPPPSTPAPEQPIVSREQARAAGAKTYFLGKPCNHGHLAPRYTSNAACTVCVGSKKGRGGELGQ